MQPGTDFVRSKNRPTQHNIQNHGSLSFCVVHGGGLFHKCRQDVYYLDRDSEDPHWTPVVSPDQIFRAFPRVSKLPQSLILRQPKLLSYRLPREGLSSQSDLQSLPNPPIGQGPPTTCIFGHLWPVLRIPPSILRIRSISCY